MLPIEAKDIIYTIKSPTMYLAGPISGLTYEQGQDWRKYVDLSLPQIITYSPLRYIKPFVGNGIIVDDRDISCIYPLRSDKGLTARDRFDCTKVDLVFANFLGATECSPGTPIEFGWADANRIPILMVIEPTGNPYDHAMIRDIASWRVSNIDEGIKLCRRILLS